MVPQLARQARHLMRQRVFADPARADGRSTDGTPGDCLRTALAVLTGQPYDQVPHAALYGLSWLDVLRRWARTLDSDIAYLTVHGGSIRYAFPHGPPARLIAIGPSPRSALATHAVVANGDLEVVHDPHPSGAGLPRVDDVLVWCAPYDDPPIAPMRELAAGPVR
jgi:hypothetical protein